MASYIHKHTHTYHQDTQGDNQINKQTTIMEVLTDNAISKLLSIENGMNECFVVDLSRQKKNKKRLNLMISDGDQKFKGFIDLTERTKDVQQLMKKTPRGVLRVRILQHITHFQQNDPTDIEIVDLQVTKERGVKAQASRPVKIQHESFKPINYTPFIPQSTPLHPSVFFPSTLPPNENPLQAVIKENLKNNSNTNFFKPLPRLQCKSDDQEDTQSDYPLPTRHDPYQTVSQLYEQYYHWKIVVRIYDASYNEFISKIGKFTKLMKLELIDREGTTISACLFGDDGKAKLAQLKIGGIYRISRGKIQLDRYNKDKRDNQSKYCIIISKDTEFCPLDDDVSIPQCRHNWLRLDQLTQLTKSDALYNFIAILVDIQEGREIPKPEKTVYLRKVHVGDPSTGLVIEVTIWSRQIQIDEALLGKSILLKRFKLNHYREKISLNASQSSQIVPHPLLSAFEGSCSFHVPRYTTNPNSQSVRTLRDIVQQLSNTAFNVPLYSYVDVWVKQMFFDKKWLYESCPSCKRTCTGNSTNRCQKCQGPIDTPHRAFKLQIKLADISGSVTITAFDGAAPIFLKQTPMDELFPMSNKELCEYADSYFVYEQYRVNLKSCRDMLGQQIHSLIGKPVPLNVTDGVQGNLMRIAAIRQEIRQNQRRSYF